MCQVFENVNTEEKLAEHWPLWRDNERLCLNVIHEVGVRIDTIEMWSRNRWLVRAPGFDFQTTRLSYIRQLCRILEVDSFHGKCGMALRFDQAKLDELEQ